MKQFNAREQFIIAAAGSQTLFGYYDLCPWNADQSAMLFGRTEILERHPDGSDLLRLGVFRVDSRSEYFFSSSKAWNWQMGCRMQWHPADPAFVIFNERRNGQFVAVIADVHKRNDVIVCPAYYALHPSGEEAVTLNFARLADVRPGYGYPGPRDPSVDVLSPYDDGVYHVDVKNGKRRLLFSLGYLRDVGKYSPGDNAKTWVNHLMYSPSGDHFVFLHRWRYPSETWFHTRMFVSSCDGNSLQCIAEGFRMSHFTWADDENLIAWLYHPNGSAFYVVHRMHGVKQAVGVPDLYCNGHCNVLNGTTWMLTDTYPEGANRIRKLFLYDLEGGECHEVLALPVPIAPHHDIRCDFHTRWSRDGRQVCLDSAHSGIRCMHVYDVSNVVARSPKRQPH